MLRTRQSLDKFFLNIWKVKELSFCWNKIINHKIIWIIKWEVCMWSSMSQENFKDKAKQKKKRYTNQNKWYLLGLFLSVEESLHRGLFHWLTSLHAVYKSYPSSFQSNCCLNKTSFLGQHSCNSWSPWLNFKCKSNSVPLFFYDPLFPGIAIASLITL